MARHPWFPLYFADYEADTKLLSLEEHGLYFLLLGNHWQHGPLPKEVEKLSKMVGITARKLRKLWHIIETYFVEENGFLVNRRMMAEMIKRSNISEKNRESAEKRWKKKKPKGHANALPKVDANAYANGYASHNHSHNHRDTDVSLKGRGKGFIPPTKDEVREYAETRAADGHDVADPDRFWDYFDAGNWHDSHGKPVISWKQKFITHSKRNFDYDSRKNDNTTAGMVKALESRQSEEELIRKMEPATKGKPDASK